MVNKSQKLDIGQLSSYLFWDVDKERLDIDRDKVLIIRKVLEYGLWQDWQLIYKYYGINEIVQTVKTLRAIDKKAASFIAAITNTPLREFKCFSITQSKDQLWNF